MATAARPKATNQSVNLQHDRRSYARHSFPSTLPHSTVLEGVSADWLTSQYAEVLRAQRENELLGKKLAEKREKDGDTLIESDSAQNSIVGTNPAERLVKLESRVESLSLALDFAGYRERFEVPLPSNLKLEVRQCAALASVLTRHNTSLKIGSLYQLLYDRYTKIRNYARGKAILSVRRALRKCNYPAPEGCDALSDEISVWEEDNNGYGNGHQEETFVESSMALVILQLAHDRLMNHMGSNAPQRNQWGRLDLLDELCRPIVKRVCFHFLGDGDMKSAIGSSDSKVEPENTTSSRLDSLPQWLFQYMKGVIDDGPYDLIREDLQPLIDRWIQKFNIEQSENICLNASTRTGMTHDYGASPTYFLVEMTRLKQHILQKRGFFNHPMIVGEDANPIHLSNGIGQLLSFDSFVADLLGETRYFKSVEQGVLRDISSGQEITNNDGLRSRRMAEVVPRLIDSFVSSNEVLMEWWISADKEQILSTLAATSNLATEESIESLDTEGGSIRIKIPISPVAETFVSLLYSARRKANSIGIADRRRDYVAKAILPTCMHFIEIMHEQASSARNLLVQRKKGSTLPSDNDLSRNVLSWVEIITGTHLAAVALADSNDVVTPGADEDLGRVGRSLERLRDAMIEEFGSSFVETILSERARMVGYLMRCPHMLSSHCHDLEHLTLSHDLHEVAHVLSVVLKVCDSVSVKVQEIFNGIQRSKNASYRDPGLRGISSGATDKMCDIQVFGFACNAIKNDVARRINEKFLEVALDVHGMIPEVRIGGAKQFLFDTDVIVSTFDNRYEESAVKKDTFARLGDATKLMVMENEKMISLRDALKGLARSEGGDFGQEENDDGPLCYDTLESDGTVLEEAKSMLNAQGLISLEVEDAVSIMNRRKH